MEKNNLSYDLVCPYCGRKRKFKIDPNARFIHFRNYENFTVFKCGKCKQDIIYWCEVNIKVVSKTFKDIKKGSVKRVIQGSVVF